MINHYISILIPLYNGIEFLEESINSVLSQTYKNWELIIGINGHKDDNEFINKVNNIINKYNKKNFDIKIFNFDFKGKAITLNNLVIKSKYNYIALLDVDDKWKSNKLEMQIKYLDEYDVVGRNCEYFGDINNYSPNIPYGDISNFDIFSFNPLINSSVIIKKNIAYWCEDNNIILEDYDLWFRLYNESIKIYNIKEILCYHRIHKKSFFNNSNIKNLNLLKNKWLNIKYIN